MEIEEFSKRGKLFRKINKNDVGLNEKCIFGHFVINNGGFR